MRLMDVERDPKLYSQREEMRLQAITCSFLVLLCSANCIHAQQGLLNIACGSTSNFTDKRGLSWIPDTKYIKVGQTHRVSQNLSDTFDYFQNLRKYPKPLNKSCYEIPVCSAQRYLLRLSFINNFVSNNHTNWPGPFKYSVETTDMLYESDKLDGSSYEYEQVLMTNARIVYVCLNRISEADPFISAIQVIELKHGMYQWARPGRILVLQTPGRVDLGGDLNRLIRYPIDDFDRIWYPGYYMEKPAISTTSKISADSAADYPPSAVMQTAQLFNTSGGESLQFTLCGVAAKALILFYFSEIRNSTKSVSFSVSDSGEGTVFATNTTLLRNYTATELAVQPALQEEYTISLKALDGKSAIPCNALEFYCIVNTMQRTAFEDVEALNDLKMRLGSNSVTWSWVSDPCFIFPWQYINCNNQMRVSHLCLSGKNLSVFIPQSLGNLTGLLYLDLSNNSLKGPLPDLSNLTMLQTMNLSNNNLSGHLPPWLSKLKNLRELFVQNNNFSGEIPRQLEYLNFTDFSGNKFLVRSSKNHDVVIGAAIGASLLLFTLLAIGIILYLRKERAYQSKIKQKCGCGSSLNVAIPKSSHYTSFTMKEMISATQQFTCEIGSGGFGSVFYGKLPNGIEIAVKVLSAFSIQGKDEFLNELLLLSRVNHENLVKLLGYCDDSEQLMLVYEYIFHGSLKDHLYGCKLGNLELTWKDRLKIALDIAHGLEYLHVKCNPRIFHRDLKSANILLDKDLNAKISDLGLSRAAIDGVSHVMTSVKGTAGYLDPECFSTHRLTDKSDVFSFGVVLLELVCGRQAIEARLNDEQVNLVRWAKPYVRMGDPEQIRLIMDSRLEGRFTSIQSIALATRVATWCVKTKPYLRPAISEAINELQRAAELEQGAAFDGLCKPETSILLACDSLDHKPSASNESFHENFLELRW